jgi:hypothetical protein
MDAGIIPLNWLLARPKCWICTSAPMVSGIGPLGRLSFRLGSLSAVAGTWNVIAMIDRFL